MRTKSDERRQCILDVAMKVFRDIGYERASMSAISALVGGSKATLYSYFASKEELYATAMIDAVCEQGDAVSAMLDATDPDIRTVLSRFGVALIELLTQPDTLALVRSAMSDGGHAKLGPVLYTMGPCKGEEVLTAYLAGLPQDCGLSIADPKRAARHLKALLESGFVEPRLYGVPVEHDVHEAVGAAVDVFLRAYAA